MSPFEEHRHRELHAARLTQRAVAARLGITVRTVQGREAKLGLTRQSGEPEYGLNVKLDETLREAIEQESRKSGMTKADIVRRVLLHHFTNPGVPL